jgi:hypothetical protein
MKQAKRTSPTPRYFNAIPVGRFRGDGLRRSWSWNGRTLILSRF